MNKLRNIICYILFVLGNSNYITCFKYCKQNNKFLHFYLHNYLFIIPDMITYNVGKVNHVTKWFSNWDPQCHNDCWVSICSPHELFILTLCLENNILVRLIFLNFIPYCRSSKNCMGTVHFFTVWEPLVTYTHKVIEHSVGREQRS